MSTQSFIQKVISKGRASQGGPNRLQDVSSPWHDDEASSFDTSKKRATSRKTQSSSRKTLSPGQSAVSGTRFLQYLCASRGTNRATNTGRVSARPPGELMQQGAAKVMKNLGETVTSVVISEDRTLFAASAMNKKAIVARVSDGELVAEFTAESAINTSAIGGNGDEMRLVVGTFSGMIRFYHIASNREEYSAKFEQGNAINCLALASHATRLAVGGQAAHVVLYALTLSKQAGVGINILHRIPTYSASVLSLSLDADAKRLVAGGEAKVVQMWNLDDMGIPKRATQGGSLQPSVQFRTASAVHSLALNATGA